MFNFLILAAGLLALVFAGDYLVRGAVSLAEKLEISPLIIGLTIVAFGTSAPELFVSLQAAFDDSPGIALGNVVGSNIANVLLVLGAPALIAFMAINAKNLRASLSFMIVLTIAMVIFMATDLRVTHIEGGLLFAGILSYLGWQIYKAKCERSDSKDSAPDHSLMDEDMPESTSDIKKIIFFLLIGLIGLPFGAHLTVEGAENIARTFGVTEAVIGVTVVAFGTSLPELVTSVMAAIRRTGAVAIGNVIGSNVFNIGLIVGLTGLIVPLDVDPHLMRIDIPMMIFATLLLTALAFWARPINRLGGALMVGAYVAYIFVLF